MTKRKGIGVPGAVVVLAGLVIVGMIAGGVGPFAVTDGPDAVTDDDAVASLSFKVKDAQADSVSYLKGDYYVYDSQGLQVASGETATDSFTTVNDLDENSEYTVKVVDDDGTDSDDIYSASQTVTTGEATERFVIDADRQGSISLSVSEDSGVEEDDSTLALNQGKTGTATLEIEENSGDAVINEPAVFLKTNDTGVVENMEVDGASEITTEVDRLSDYGEEYDLGVAQIADYGQENVDVQITATDSAASDATVTMAVVDGDEFQTDQDTWKFGYEDSGDNDIRLGDSSTTVTVTQP